MGLTTADSYYLKAKAATGGFFSDWEEVCEALNYALSYDEQHCAALCLLGEIYAKHLSRHEEAYECFDKIIAADNTYQDVYPKYVKHLIWANETDRAEKLITYAASIKTIDEAQLLWLSCYVEETKGNYKNCLVLLKKAKLKIYNDYYLSFMEDEERRIKKKIKLEKPKKKKKKKGKSSKKSKKKTKNSKK
jgi:tetratricopeptide (TPR) repeat protein